MVGVKMGIKMYTHSEWEHKFLEYICVFYNFGYLNEVSYGYTFKSSKDTYKVQGKRQKHNFDFVKVESFLCTKGHCYKVKR